MKVKRLDGDRLKFTEINRRSTVNKRGTENEHDVDTTWMRTVNGRLFNEHSNQRARCFFFFSSLIWKRPLNALANESSRTELIKRKKFAQNYRQITCIGHLLASHSAHRYHSISIHYYHHKMWHAAPDRLNCKPYSDIAPHKRTIQRAHIVKCVYDVFEHTAQSAFLSFALSQSFALSSHRATPNEWKRAIFCVAADE